MKKFKLLLISLLFIAFVAPFSVRAEEDNTQERSKINVYIFRGEGCGFCAKALSFFESIEKEYGKYYNLVTYEIWNNADNAALMDQVAEYLDVSIKGVPFIIIGNETYDGFQDSMSDELKSQILAEYNRNDDERTDIIKNMQNGLANKNGSSDTVITIVSLVVIAGIVAFVVFARKDNSSKDKKINSTKDDEYIEEKESSDDEEDEIVEVKPKKEKNAKTEKKKETQKSTVKKTSNTTTKKKTTTSKKK